MIIHTYKLCTCIHVQYVCESVCSPDSNAPAMGAPRRSTFSCSLQTHRGQKGRGILTKVRDSKTHISPRPITAAAEIAVPRTCAACVCAFELCSPARDKKNRSGELDRFYSTWICQFPSTHLICSSVHPEQRGWSAPHKDFLYHNRATVWFSQAYQDRPKACNGRNGMCK